MAGKAERSNFTTALRSIVNEERRVDVGAIGTFIETVCEAVTSSPGHAFLDCRLASCTTRAVHFVILDAAPPQIRLACEALAGFDSSRSYISRKLPTISVLSVAQALRDNTS